MEVKRSLEGARLLMEKVKKRRYIKYIRFIIGRSWYFSTWERGHLARTWEYQVQFSDVIDSPVPRHNPKTAVHLSTVR